MVYLFLTMSVHHQEQLISCTSHLVYAGTIRLTSVAIATQQYQPGVPAYTKCDVQLIKLLLKMVKYSPKRVEHLVENKV